jgi:dihydroorotase-like cyclic amidohydrolase
MTMLSRTWLFLTALGLILSGRVAGDDLIAFKGVHVFDGERVLPEVTVVVRDATISSVTAGAQVPDGAKVIDGRGKTLLPGLIDAHTHTFTPEHLRAAVVFGVTTELDMFTSP